eukprot:gnl/TRDRNA2_/TRDRNA2_75648_c1_seq2.p1 gnl/TRDRNA2_/TRDRNA2_75648_c1~~gnl/TRDRNA2_/TRDRNA2_75648_c1_seq2.p1  ORF type:complete len:219 (+),score=32.81 gnl/TRDRNA2_/TRDRNA2_75648_c1_seq2:37-657(+)
MRAVAFSAGPPSGTPLSQLCRDLLVQLAADGRGVLSERFLSQSAGGALPLPSTTAWRILLEGVRISAVCNMPTSLPTVRLELKSDPNTAKLTRESFPTVADDKRANSVVIVTNDVNVYFAAQLHWVLVSDESSADACCSLTWRLNRPRLRILLRAREAGAGPLASLEDDVARLVRDFIAPPPSSRLSPDDLRLISALGGIEGGKRE